MEIAELRAQVRRVVEDPALSYRQRMHQLAGLAENALEPPPVSEACARALDKRIICDMYEGNAPHRPRYVLPDYAKALAQGSAFLELDPPRDLDEALDFLLIMYTQVPSITGYPVYVGDLDKVLAPYVEGPVSRVDDDEALYRRLRRFWIALDRMLPDAFTHTDLGPDDSRIARAVLRIERELLQVVPNLTLKVDPERTPDSLVADAVQTVYACGKPHFANHPMMVADHGEDYAVVSCYNALKVAGGSHTLTRLNLKEAAVAHDGRLEEFFTGTLPHYVELTAELTESRIRYLVEQARFYETSWLAQEGLVDLSRFSAMLGVFGLAEAVDVLLDREQDEPATTPRYGHTTEGNALAYRIMQAVAELVAARPMPYCEGGGGRAYLHAQSGIDLDIDVTAGTRVPIGAEPPLFEHLMAVAPHHRLFVSGVSDVLAFDDTVRDNPQAVVDIIRGAFVRGMRDFTFNLDSNDFIRITGYLVRKSDLAKMAAAEGQVRTGSDFLAAGAVANQRVEQRVPKQLARRVISHESSPRAGR